MHLVAFGLGYSARALATRLAKSGWRVTGTATSSAGWAQIRKLGFEACTFDGSRPGALVADALKTATHIVVSAPPGNDGDPVLAHHAADIAASPAQWIGYLSTIGVYGDRHGDWVDETDAPRPGSDRSKRRAQAEDAWLEFGHEHGKRVQAFRLAGIYGPGRSAIDNVIEGSARRVVKPGQVFNRIHVADIARVLEAAIAGQGSHEVYNVADDEPAPPQDVIAFAARLLGLPEPPAIPFDEARLTPMAASFYTENKRVRNTRLKHDLGVELQFPNYRAGLESIAQQLT